VPYRPQSLGGRVLRSLLPLVFLGACQASAQPDIRTLRLDATSLANLLGDASDREVLVYLPPGYEQDGSTRYPVAYLLHAFGAGPATWLGGTGSYEGLDVAATLDDLIAEGEVEPMIVVMPDAHTRLGGTWYADSPVSGEWERFLARDLVRWVDERFRTIPSRQSRGLVGQSMGAYGALRIGMHHADVFGAVVAVSPLIIDDPNPLGDVGARIALDANTQDLADAPLPARVLWSRATAFSPAPDLPPAYARFPYRVADGEVVVVDEVWQAWRRNSLRALADTHRPELARLRIRMEVGDQDAVAAEVESWSAALGASGVEHELEVFHGGHVEGVRDRFESAVFQYLSRAFASPR
jgi:enterochelin esterase-like enzyme